MLLSVDSGLALNIWLVVVIAARLSWPFLHQTRLGEQALQCVACLYISLEKITGK